MYGDMRLLLRSGTYNCVGDLDFVNHSRKTPGIKTVLAHVLISSPARLMSAGKALRQESIEAAAAADSATADTSAAGGPEGGNGVAEPA